MGSRAGLPQFHIPLAPQNGGAFDGADQLPGLGSTGPLPDLDSFAARAADTLADFGLHLQRRVMPGLAPFAGLADHARNARRMALLGTPTLGWSDARVESRVMPADIYHQASAMYRRNPDQKISISRVVDSFSGIVTHEIHRGSSTTAPSTALHKAAYIPAQERFFGHETIAHFHPRAHNLDTALTTTQGHALNEDLSKIASRLILNERYRAENHPHEAPRLTATHEIFGFGKDGSPARITITARLDPHTEEVRFYFESFGLSSGAHKSLFSAGRAVSERLTNLARNTSGYAAEMLAGAASGDFHSGVDALNQAPFEPGDWVIARDTGKRWSVQSIENGSPPRVTLLDPNDATMKGLYLASDIVFDTPAGTQVTLPSSATVYEVSRVRHDSNFLALRPVGTSEAQEVKDGSGRIENFYGRIVPVHQARSANASAQANLDVARRLTDLQSTRNQGRKGNPDRVNPVDPVDGREGRGGRNRHQDRNSSEQSPPPNLPIRRASAVPTNGAALLSLHDLSFPQQGTPRIYSFSTTRREVNIWYNFEEAISALIEGRIPFLRLVAQDSSNNMVKARIAVGADGHLTIKAESKIAQGWGIFKIETPRIGIKRTGQRDSWIWYESKPYALKAGDTIVLAGTNIQVSYPQKNTHRHPQAPAG